MSVEKSIIGTFRVRYRIGRKQFSKTFKRKIDAEKFDAKARLNEVILPAKSAKISFKVLSDEYLKRHARVFKAESSVVEDISMLNRHLLPAFAHYPLEKLTRNGIESHRAAIKSSGLANKTVNNIFGLLHRILGLAVRWNYLPSNPCQGIGRLRLEHNEMMFWSFQEKTKFLSWAKSSDDYLHDVCAILLHTGLRLGELKGLKRDCLDFETNTIIVRRTYCQKSKQLLERTKSYHSRRVPMNSEVRAILLKRALVPADAMIFPTFHRNNFSNRLFRPGIDQCGVTRIRLHDLRHTFASHLAMQGVDVMRIKMLLGHSDLAVTQKYMHLSPTATDGVTELLLAKGCVKNVYSGM